MRKVNLEEFKKEVFKNIAPMGNLTTREHLIDIIDELTEAREEIANLKALLGGAKVPRGKLEKWLSESMFVMKKVNFLELNIVRNRIELEMSSLGMILSKKEV